MKLAAPMVAMLSAPRALGSLRALGGLLVVFGVAVMLFSMGFHAIMALEGRDYSWPTSTPSTMVAIRSSSGHWTIRRPTGPFAPTVRP